MVAGETGALQGVGLSSKVTVLSVSLVLTCKQGEHGLQAQSLRLRLPVTLGNLSFLIHQMGEGIKQVVKSLQSVILGSLNTNALVDLGVK